MSRWQAGFWPSLEIGNGGLIPKRVFTLTGLTAESRSQQ